MGLTAVADRSIKCFPRAGYPVGPAQMGGLCKLHALSVFLTERNSLHGTEKTTRDSARVETDPELEGQAFTAKHSETISP